MPCFHPLAAYRTGSGQVVFSEVPGRGVVSALTLPCGQCLGCRLERSRQWAVRCMHEAALHQDNAFVTLTYSPENLPFRGQLDYPEFQQFMRRFRKAVKKTQPKLRFYMAGEYGSRDQRPHYHALIFGYDFPDKEYFKKTDAGENIYTSKLLSRLWPLGHASTGAVTFESAAYVARYCVTKVTGKAAEAHYRRFDEHGEYQLTPEFNHMSLKPGIGQGFVKKYQSDIYPNDYVVVNGHKAKPPKYYDKYYEEVNPDEFEHIKLLRMLEADKYLDDNTPQRLADKAEVAAARINLFSRT